MEVQPSTDLATAPQSDIELQDARKDVKRLRDLYPLLLVTVAVTALTAIIDLMRGNAPLFRGVVIAFGIALAFCALDTVGRSLWLRRGWRERKPREHFGRRDRR